MNVGVGVIARAPSSAGKSRLAPHLSPPRLAALRSAMLADTLHALGSVSGLTIFFTPDDADDEIARYARADVSRVAQGDGDLGARMLAAIRTLLTRGCDLALLVGSDIPLLGAEHLREASEVAQGFSAATGVVLGPADDGGYYLIGMTAPQPQLFDGVEWGSDSVLTDTLRIADRTGLDVRLVRSAYDVDTIADLRRVERDLAALPGTMCPNLRRWLSEA